MDDAETEAVLLALGEPLRWEIEDKPGSRVSEIARHKGGTYWAVEIIVGWRAVMLTAMGPQGRSINRAPRLYTSQAEAKAACERYHATAKWEE